MFDISVFFLLSTLWTQELDIAYMQQLPREIKKHIFSAQDIKKIPTIKAWHLLHSFSKLTENLKYDEQDRAFIEQLVCKAIRACAYRPSCGICVPSAEIFNTYYPISGLLILSKLQKNMKTIFTAVAIREAYYWRKLAQINDNTQPEMLLASLAHQCIDTINNNLGRAYYYAGSRSLIISPYFFELDAILKHLGLAHPDFDINTSRKKINALRKKYGLRPIKNPESTRCEIM